MKKWKGPTAEELDGMFSIDVVKYVCCNFLRPFSSNYEKMESIVKYILDDENIKKEDVIL